MLDGAIRGVEEGWYQGEIADSAYELERKLNAGRHVVVGVNAFLEGNDEPPPADRCASAPRSRRNSAAGSTRCSAERDAAVARSHVPTAEPTST